MPATMMLINRNILSASTRSIRAFRSFRLSAIALLKLFVICGVLFFRLASVAAQAENAPPKSSTQKDSINKKDTAPTYSLELYASGYEKPVQIVESPAEGTPAYVVQQTGKVIALDPEKAKRATILELGESLVVTEEAGLLGFAFHPNFSSNRLAYAHYIGKSRENENRISEFHISSGTPAGEGDERKLIRLLQKSLANLGGQIAFGPDKQLYVSIGDGDGRGDSENRGQNQQDQFGNILRIGVEEESSTKQAYLAPVDNPFVANGLGHRDVWAAGLRNPRTFSFDVKNEGVWVGDAGDGVEQEINLAKAGGNYGWSVFDGVGCLRMRFECMNKKYQAPIVSYLKTSGTSVTVGFTYQGSKFPELQGALLYGDKKSGKLWALKYEAGKLVSNTLVLETRKELSCFGKTEQGEPLLADYSKGDVWLLTPKAH